LRETPLLRFGGTLGEAARAYTLILAAKLHQAAHSAVMDYSPCYCKMERAAIIGDMPIQDFVPHPNPFDFPVPLQGVRHAIPRRFAAP
jgi:hypothetical protein